MKAMEMARAARTIVEVCGRVKPGEKVCVVRDTTRVGIAEIVVAAARPAADVIFTPVSG